MVNKSEKEWTDILVYLIHEFLVYIVWNIDGDVDLRLVVVVGVSFRIPIKLSFLMKICCLIIPSFGRH